MAGFAARSLTVRAALLHTILELSLVRIDVATGAGEFIPVIRNCLWFEALALLVTIAARDCHVAAGKDESGLLVTRQGKCRRSIPLQIVATLTAVEVWRSGKLPRMFITMAIGAALKFDL